MASRMIYRDDNLEIRVPNELEAPLHFEAIQASFKDISAWENWCSAGYSLEDSRTYLIDSFIKRQRGLEYRYCLYDLPSGKIIGSVALNRIVHEYKTANIGYWIRSDFTGRFSGGNGGQGAGAFRLRRTGHDPT